MEKLSVWGKKALSCTFLPWLNFPIERKTKRRVTDASVCCLPIYLFRCHPSLFLQIPPQYISLFGMWFSYILIHSSGLQSYSRAFGPFERAKKSAKIFGVKVRGRREKGTPRGIHLDQYITFQKHIILFVSLTHSASFSWLLFSPADFVHFHPPQSETTYWKFPRGRELSLHPRWKLFLQKLLYRKKPSPGKAKIARDEGTKKWRRVLIVFISLWVNLCSRQTNPFILCLHFELSTSLHWYIIKDMTLVWALSLRWSIEMSMEGNQQPKGMKSFQNF